MKIWVDTMREPPDYSYLWCRNDQQAISAVKWYEHNFSDDEILIDLESNTEHHDFLFWLEAVGVVDTGYFFKFHTTQFVKPSDIETIIKKNGWRLIK